MSNTQTFIFVHDQNIILDFIKTGKFSRLPNLKFIFLGNRPVDKIVDNSNIIIARELPYNIEEYPKLVSFTGWYVIWKNNLYSSEYINFFEYDINLKENFYSIDFNDSDITGYITTTLDNPNLFKSEEFCALLIDSIFCNYNLHLLKLVDHLPDDYKFSVTSNHTFSKNAFESYMKWVEPLIDDLKNNFYAGHLIERSICAFYVIENIYKHKVYEDVIEHLNLDSHQTGGYDSQKQIENYHLLL